MLALDKRYGTFCFLCRSMPAVALLFVLNAGPAHALGSPLSFQAGVEYSRSVDDQSTRSALAMGTLNLGFRLSAGVLRYDDSQAGLGNGFLGAVGVPLLPSMTLNAQVVRYVGDESFRAWRGKVGPEISLPLGVAAQVSYIRQQEDGGGHLNGVAGELALPVAPMLTARANASFASLPNGLDATAGALGLGWRPIPFFEITGEVGLARNGTLNTTTSSPPLGGLPVLGDLGGASPSETREGSRTEPTFLIGLQTRFP